MYNIWIVWLVVSMFTVSIVGLHRQFVATKISGRILVIDRIPFKWVKRMILIFTIVFALTYGIDSFLYAMKFVEASIIYNIAYWMRWSLITAGLVVAYNAALRFLYNKAKKENESEVREELRWRHMLKRG